MYLVFARPRAIRTPFHCIATGDFAVSVPLAHLSYRYRIDIAQCRPPSRLKYTQVSCRSLTAIGRRDRTDRPTFGLLLSSLGALPLLRTWGAYFQIGRRTLRYYHSVFGTRSAMVYCTDRIE